MGSAPQPNVLERNVAAGPCVRRPKHLAERALADPVQLGVALPILDREHDGRPLARFDDGRLHSFSWPCKYLLLEHFSTG